MGRQAKRAPHARGFSLPYLLLKLQVQNVKDTHRKTKEKKTIACISELYGLMTLSFGPIHNRPTHGCISELAGSYLETESAVKDEIPCWNLQFYHSPQSSILEDCINSLIWIEAQKTIYYVVPLGLRTQAPRCSTILITHPKIRFLDAYRRVFWDLSRFGGLRTTFGVC